ncbi:hypothetical protein GE061_005806 [Apolygus lucorum]|uniref:MADF domain-containing protein n=1 Tax=Apolygus lucorum TaxID=248454 RepID=A0A8S9WZ17_APOLU|nr:hypothetical protein GE061_005806 [Apolygus lucorum]
MSGPGIARTLESEDLIEEVRRRPVVYNDRLRTNRSAAEDAWTEISQLLGFDVQTCKLKWYDLRNTYLRRKKRKFCKPAPSCDPHHYFELMGFLDSEATREKDIDDMIERNKAQSVDSTVKLDAEMVDADTLKTPPHRSHFSLSTVGLPKNTNTTEVVEPVSSDSAEYNSDLHFFISLLPLMKQLSPQDNLDVRIQIQSILKRKLFPNN